VDSLSKVVRKMSRKELEKRIIDLTEENRKLRELLSSIPNIRVPMRLEGVSTLSEKRDVRKEAAQAILQICRR